MNIQETTQLMAILGTEYPKNFEVTPERIKLWVQILQHASYQEATQAIAKLLGEARPFPPVVGEINQEIILAREEEFRILRIKQQDKKTLPSPEITQEQKEKNLSILKKLSDDIARKKAMRQ